uniref:ARID domain-containing protein n=1 Tax=Anopheles dirus TaxID=7168 RepID=A0A182NLS6_9DIPT
MTTDVVKTERSCLPMALDDTTNDASGASFSSVTGPGVVGIAGTPKESVKSQNVRRNVAKPMFEKDKCSFLNDLQMFHDKHGTPYSKLPKISGKDVDLHKLYSIVIGRGGWMKVNAREDWDEVIEELDLPTRCVNNEIALKQIYIRFLDRYERVNFHGEEKDPTEDDDDEKRLHRRWSVRMLHSTPTVYNHHQHNVPEGLRSSLKLSDDLYRASEYDKLILSLLSPLPNEQDFAINVCTLMSNENKHTLKVDKCPRLLYALLAHAGVFNHFSMRDTFNEYYSNIRKNSLQRFWKECLFEKPQVLELSLEDCFAKMGKDPSALIATIYQDEQDELDANGGSGDGEDGEKPDCEIMGGRLSTASLRTFLSLGTGLGTNDYIGQRVLQIAAIFRNLSFNEENLHVLGRNRTFIRFLIMCANARWNNLHHLGLDMLGNIANEIDINDPQSDEVTRCLVSTLSEGLEGADRGVIISCLEVLSKIAQKEANEENLNRCLNQQLYDQMCLFLCLNDIMLLLYTLECIYSLTSMGEKPCGAIMHIRGVIDTLVSLVTVEAQSYGPDACILMRVVETIPGNMVAQHHGQGGYYPNATGPGGQGNPPPPTMAQLTVHKDGGQVQGAMHNAAVYPTPDVPKLPALTIASKPVPSPPILVQQPPPVNAPTVQSTVPAQGQPAANAAQIVTVTRPPAADSPQIPVNVIARPDPALASVAQQQQQQQQSHQQQQQQIQQSSTVNLPNAAQGSVPNQSAGIVVQSPAPISIAAKHMQQQQAQESEQFAYAWLRASFEAAAAVRMDQQELYKLYLATNAKLGRKVIVPQPHFPRCVRAVFGGTVGPVQLKVEQNGVETVGYFYEGLRPRAKPLPIVHKGTVLTPAVDYPSVAGSTSSCSVTKHDDQSHIKISTAATSTVPTPSNASAVREISAGHAHPVPIVNRTPVQETRSLDVTPTVQGTQTTSSGTLRSSSVIALAPPSSGSNIISAKPHPFAQSHSVSVVQKAISAPMGKPSQQQPTPKTILQFSQQQQQPMKSLVPNSVSSSSPSLVETRGGSTSIGKQFIVTQVGGKSVVINKTATGQQHQYIPSTPSSPLLQQVLSGDQKNNVIVVNQTTISPQPAGTIHSTAGPGAHLQTGTGTTTIMNQSGTISSTTTNPSALIKSLLANKVTTAVTDSTLSAGTAGTSAAAAAVAAAAAAAAAAPYSSSLPTTTITNSPTTNCLIAPNVNVHQVAQRQQMQKQKQMIEQKLLPNATINPSVVVTSNNPNNLTNIKVGNSTISIKPGTLPTNTVITATNPHETSFNAPPPLAPLSQTPTGQHLATASAKPLLPNKVLSELLEKKPGEMIIAGDTTIKRKFEVTDTSMEPPMKRMEGGTKTADLYAELAGSITEANPNASVTSQQLTSQTTATIKTESGYQTVPIILQHHLGGGGGAGSSLQLQKTSTPGGGAGLMQSTVLSAAPQHPQPTQYILATNPQGQTYVVAQQPQPQPQLQQTVLLAQGQQHGSTGQKTIIIVQQQQPQPPNAGAMQQMTMQNPVGVPTQGQTQKIFLNQQGQQILMTQLPRQVIVSHAGPSSSAGTTIITSSAPTTMSVGGGQSLIAGGGGGGTIIEKKPIYITTNAQGNTISFEGPPQQLQMQAIQQAAGGTSYQIKPYAAANTGVLPQQHIIQQANISSAGSVGQQTIQFIQQQQQPHQVGQLPTTSQSIQPTQQIVFQAHGSAGGTAGTAQIIQQQIIQPALSQQSGGQQQHIVQKVLHQQPQQQQQHLIQTSAVKQAPTSHIITVQQQQKQQQLQQQQQQQQQQLPLAVQRPAGSLSQSIVPAKPVPVPNVGPTVVSSLPSGPTPQGGLLGGGKQIFQVVQQKLTTAPASAGGNPPPVQLQRQPVPNIPATMVAPATVVSQAPTITQTIVATQSTAPQPQPTPALVPSITVTPIPATQSAPAAPTNNGISTSAPTATQSQPVASTPATSAPVANTITIPASIAAGGPGATNSTTTLQMIPSMDPQKIVEEDVEPSWPWMCDWRGCPKKRFQSATEVFRHACTVHCPDTVDVTADIYCQWGPGPNLCDNLPRKRFSLMTHILDRHCTAESFKAAVQRRLAGGPQQPTQPYPVTLVRQSAGSGNSGSASLANGAAGASSGASSSSTSSGTSGERGSPAPAACTKVESGSTATESGGISNGPGQLSAAGPAAMHAIKRYSMDYVNSKEFQDEMEGPVTKSIRLTSALILRNLVVYTTSARRSLRRYESHLAGVALSNVESSRTVAQLLFEMNDTGPNY